MLSKIFHSPSCVTRRIERKTQEAAREATDASTDSDTGYDVFFITQGGIILGRRGNSGWPLRIFTRTGTVDRILEADLRGAIDG